MSLVERDIVAPWIQTYSGERFELLDPSLDSIKIADIAHSLSMLARFNGHTRVFYSVAEHSVLVSEIVPEEFALFGLLHDASEAYIGDMASPVKGLFPDFKLLSDDIEHRIFEKYHVDVTEEGIAAVKEADLQMLKIEFEELLKDAGHLWDILDDIPSMNGRSVKLSILSPFEAKAAFIKRFNELI